MLEDINFFAQTNFRNQKKKFGIRLSDRRQHVYVIGKTGMGKSNLLLNMAIQDIQKGYGMGFVDPHGEAAESLLDFIPESRIKDVVYFNPADLNNPISFNVMEDISPETRHLVASGLMGVFKKIWPDVWSARMEYILHNAILALLEYPDSTLLGVNRMLADEDYRKKVVEKIKDPIIKTFWTLEFGRYTQRYEVEATAAIQNKIGQFISSPLIRNIIGQVKSTLNIREAMDKQKILILNLSKGRIGEDSSKLLGGLFITKIQLAAMSRVDSPELARKDFFLYVDEFQNFATESFANILSEARKYRLDLTLGHQYISQMEETVRDAVFGNVGTLISFRIGAEDAEFLEREFAPEFTAGDLVNLPRFCIYLKLMINGITSSAFSAVTLPPFPLSIKSFREEIVNYSRQSYSNKREEVERAIAEWTGDFVLSPESGKNSAELYDIICSKCGKKSKVPFMPEKNRPVYCKACKKSLEQKNSDNPEHSKNENKDSEEKKDRPGASLEDVLLKNIVYFSEKKSKKQKKAQESDVKERVEHYDSLRQAIKEARQEEKTPAESMAEYPTEEKHPPISQEKVKIDPGQIIDLKK